jgi:hypothetical protein
MVVFDENHRQYQLLASGLITPSIGWFSHQIKLLLVMCFSVIYRSIFIPSRTNYQCHLLLFHMAHKLFLFVLLPVLQLTVRGMVGLEGRHSFGLYALITMLLVCMVIWIMTSDKNASDKD